jgi:hypothetical protein
MKIERNEQNLKKNFLIRFNLDPNSNEIECSLDLPKHDLQRISTETGIQIDFNKQNSKHESSICLNHDPDSNEIEWSFELLKHDLQRISTGLGMQIDRNEQNSKEDSPIRFNFDPNSNEIKRSFEILKHDLQRISTELGMQMDCSEQYSKEGSPIRFNLDPDSNMSESILLFVAQLPAKHDLHRISTKLGMQIDFIEQNSKHEPSIRFNLDSDSNEIQRSVDFAKHDLHGASKDRTMQTRRSFCRFQSSDPLRFLSLRCTNRDRGKPKLPFFPLIRVSLKCLFGAVAIVAEDPRSFV